MTQQGEEIVITGAAIATSLGLDLATTWEAVCAGRCGVGTERGSALEQLPDPDHGVGQAPQLPADFLPDAPREVRYLRHVLNAALHDARIEAGDLDPARTGFVLGTTLHGMRAAGVFLRGDQIETLRDFQASAVIASVSQGFSARGFAATTCAACASGLASIALAATLLRAGKLDRVIAGGYDPISEYAYAGFNSLRLIAHGPQRPFARGRSGMKVGEGYGLVVLERQADAARRGAPMFARLVASGASADAHHLSQPHPEGIGAARAIRQAIESGGLSEADIDLVAAHATATQDNDGAEYRALKAVFGERRAQVFIAAFKSNLGHSLGAAGAVELILSAKALREGLVPQAANICETDCEFDDLRLVTRAPCRAPLKRAMVVSLGFGGSNACAIIESIGAAPVKEISHRAGSGRSLPYGRGSDRAVITGLGVVFPGAIGNAAFAAMLDEIARGNTQRGGGTVDDERLAEILTARRLRRLSGYVKMSLAATALAVREARFEDVIAGDGRGGAIIGTTHGSAGYSEEYYRQVVEQGIAAANPVLFAEGVPNAGAAHLSTMLGLRGPCQTIIGSRTAGLDAVTLAAARIESGEWDWAIINAADEYSPLVNRAYGHYGLYSAGAPAGEGFASGAGSVSLILESRAFAEARGAKVLATVEATGQTTWSASSPADAMRSIAAMVRGLGPACQVIPAATGTSLDRLEAIAVRRAFGQPVAPASLNASVAECFSAMPLAAMAGVLLTGSPPGTFTVLASDYNGVTAGARLSRG